MSPMGELKEKANDRGDVGFMRQVLRCRGSIRYFPSDSTPTANQSQMRNTNTRTVARRLYSAILELFQAVFSPRPASLSCAYSELAHSVL